nr:xylulose kinase-1 [Tanacetum cinerariifolium]
MAPLTFADTHNMVAYLSKSDASVGFDQIMDFLNAQVIQYALMVNPTIYVSCIKQFWATTSIKKANDVVKLQALIDRKKLVVTEDVIRKDLHLDDADGVEIWVMRSRKFNFSKYIFDSMVRNVDSPSKFLMYPRVLQVLINNQVDDLSSHTIRYTSHALTQKVFANMRRVGKGFSSMLVQPQPQAAEEEDDVEIPAAPTLPSPINAPSPPPQYPIPTSP